MDESVPITVQPENVVAAGPHSAQTTGLGVIRTKADYLKLNKELTPMGLREPIHERQPQEAEEDFAMFKFYARSQPDGVNKRSMAAFLKKLNRKNIHDYEFRIKAKLWSWEIRAQSLDLAELEGVDECYITKARRRLERSKEATEELVAIVAEKARDLILHSDDPELVDDVPDENGKPITTTKNQRKLVEFAPYVSIIFGPGGVGKFLMDSYKTFHGEKIELKGKFQIGEIDWRE